MHETSRMSGRDVGWMRTGLDSPNPTPYIGFDIETYSPDGFPEDFEDPIVAATLGISHSGDIRQGLMVISLIYPPHAERSLLRRLLNLMAACPEGFLLTYNGRRFDVAYLIDRAARHRLDSDTALSKHEHADLYDIIKHSGMPLASYGQKTVEHFLGIGHEITDISGITYHLFYRRFLEEGGLKPVFYNIEDGIGCLLILKTLARKSFKAM